MPAKPLLFVACVAALVGGVVLPADAAAPRSLIATHHGRHASPHRVAADLARTRELTINRSPQGFGFEDDPDGVYLDGPIRYKDVRAFDPAPYADSGRQYPFGLDGIGGYGSDLGFLAGHDSADYDRGP